MTARNDRPAAGWWLLAELPLSVSCPAWCVEDASATRNGPLCLYHAAQAVEDGVLAARDLTVAPAPSRGETTEEAR